MIEIHGQFACEDLESFHHGAYLAAYLINLIHVLTVLLLKHLSELKVLALKLIDLAIIHVMLLESDLVALIGLFERLDLGLHIGDAESLVLDDLSELLGQIWVLVVDALRAARTLSFRMAYLGSILVIAMSL